MASDDQTVTTALFIDEILALGYALDLFLGPASVQLVVVYNLPLFKSPYDKK